MVFLQAGKKARPRFTLIYFLPHPLPEIFVALHLLMSSVNVSSSASSPASSRRRLAVRVLVVVLPSMVSVRVVIMISSSGVMVSTLVSVTV